MSVVSVTGEKLGAVTTFYELPQGIMLDVKRGHSTVMIPYRPEIIVRTDIEARTIVINDTLGLLDDTSDSSE
jgi:ribosomal 30S subunit maturation factor RimM